jgi:hypothetical protein
MEKKSKFKLKIGYDGLEGNASNINSSVLESILTTFKKIFIFSDEDIWAIRYFVGVSGMVYHMISILRAVYWITLTNVQLTEKNIIFNTIEIL